MRSVFAGLAAIWFGYNAVSFVPAFGVYLNAGAPGGIDGDPAGIAVTWAARALFVGMALVSMALVEWGSVARLLRDMFRDDPSATGDVRRG